MAVRLLRGLGARPEPAAPDQPAPGADARAVPAGPDQPAPGARARPGPGRPADLRPMLVDPIPSELDCGGGLPPGVIEWGCSLAAACAAIGGWLTGRTLAASAVGVAMMIRLPEVMAASYGSPVTLRPAEPLPFGSGWLHADVGAPGDTEALRSCLATLPAGASAGQAAAEAQAWRLAVCDYRPRPPEPLIRHPVRATTGLPPGPSSGRLADEAPNRPDHGPFSVVDLTTMWAGPLATWLLARLGARVVRVEPSFRPDGFRALDGRGIHPDGSSERTGRDSAMFNSLHDSADAGWDLDLRVPAGRRIFEVLVGGADLVVDSFSRRVMANLGYDQMPGGAMRASVTAFGPGPEEDWVAYGTGVHATSGLGDLGGGRFRPAAVSYADPLAGLALALGAVAAVAARRAGRPVGGVSTSLAAAVTPLLACSQPTWSREPPDLGPRLLALAGDLGLVAARPVGGGRRLLHPVNIFRPVPPPS